MLEELKERVCRANRLLPEYGSGHLYLGKRLRH